MTTLAKKVLEAIQLKPGIRTIEICDKVDCDIELVEQVLAVLTGEQKIRSNDGIAPNGRKAKFFEVVADAAPAPDIQQATSGTLPAAPLPPAKSKVDLAIDFIREHGQATTEQLRAVLNLKSHQHPLAWLSAAINNGRIARTNDQRWILGDGVVHAKPRTVPPRAPNKPTPAAAPAPAATLANAAAEPAAPASTVQKPTPLAAVRVIGPIAGAADQHDDAAREFVAGLFSTGELHLRVSGNWVELSPEQTTKIRHLLQGAA